MEGLATILIVLVGLFLLYKTGLMDLTQKSMERGSAMADRRLEVLDYESKEKHSRDLGKVKSKLQADKARSSSSELDRMFKAIGQELKDGQSNT